MKDNQRLLTAYVSPNVFETPDSIVQTLLEQTFQHRLVLGETCVELPIPKEIETKFVNIKVNDNTYQVRLTTVYNPRFQCMEARADLMVEK